MRVYLLSTDLMIGSQLTAAVGDYEVIISQSGEDLIAKLSGDRDLVILDLDTRTYSIATLVPAIRGHDARPRAIIAFGPHVKVDLLAAAEQADCDDVMSRGKFHREMRSLLDHWAGL